MDDHLRERKNTRTLKDRVIPERPQVRGVLRKTSEGLRRRMMEQPVSPLTSHESLKRKLEERRPLDMSLQKSLKVIGRAKREWETTVDSLPQLIDRKSTRLNYSH